MVKTHLVIIDPQNDFCYPGYDEVVDYIIRNNKNVTNSAFEKDFISINGEPNPWNNTGALFVPGAFEDMIRLNQMIERIGDKLYDIHVTMDTHHDNDIAHPSFWISGSDPTLKPNPFTIMTTDDIDNGVWKTRNPKDMKRANEYVHKLKENKRYDLCIWPPHCLIGSFGHNIVQPLYSTLLNWEMKYGWINYVTKGSNMYTEHYSAVCADVLDPSDQSTDINKRFIEVLESSDMILVAGEAKSHCVANTIYDVIDNFGEDNAKKIILLEDAMSNVPGFESLGDKFFDDMNKLGVKTSKTTEIFA